GRRSLAAAREAASPCWAERPPDPAWARRSSVGGGRHELDADALVDPALGLVADDPDPADLAGVGDMRPAIGLEVEADDLDRPDLHDARREQVDLRPDEIRYREGLIAW